MPRLSSSKPREERPTIRGLSKAGALPPGLFLQPDGRIWGFPSELGDYAFVVRVEDRLGHVATRAISLSITCRSGSSLTITTQNLPVGTVGWTYSFRFEAEGGRSPRTWHTPGPLPEGIMLDRDGWLTGVPVRSSTTSFVVRVRDAKMNEAERSFLMLVR